MNLTEAPKKKKPVGPQTGIESHSPPPLPSTPAKITLIEERVIYQGDGFEITETTLHIAPLNKPPAGDVVDVEFKPDP